MALACAPILPIHRVHVDAPGMICVTIMSRGRRPTILFMIRTALRYLYNFTDVTQCLYFCNLAPADQGEGVRGRVPTHAYERQRPICQRLQPSILHYSNRYSEQSGMITTLTFVLYRCEYFTDIHFIPAPVPIYPHVRHPSSLRTRTSLASALTQWPP